MTQPDDVQQAAGETQPCPPGAAPEPVASGSSRLRVLLLTLLKLAVAVGLLSYVIYKGEISFDRIATLFRQPALLILAILVLSVQLFVGAQRLRLLLRAQGVQVGYLTMLRLTYLGCFFDTFMVTSVGGDAVKAVYLAQQVQYGRRTEAVSTLVLDRLVGLLGLLTLAFATSLLQFEVIWSNDKMRLAYLGFLGGALGLLAGTALLFSRRVYTWPPGQWLLSKLPFGSTLNRAYGALQQYRDRPGTLALVWALSLVVHCVGMLTGYLLVLGLGYPAPAFGLFFMAWFIANVLCSFAPFAGVGIGQVFFNVIFEQLAGITWGADLATALQIAYFIGKLPGLGAWLMSRERFSRKGAS